MSMIKAEIDVDKQDGPVVRLTCGDTTVSLYIMDETATSVNHLGEWGIEVSGSWPAFKAAVLATVSAASQ